MSENVEELQRRIAELTRELDIARRARKEPGTGTAKLNDDERVALRAYLASVGTRTGARALCLARPTLASALLGGTMRPSTATVIRIGLERIKSELST